MICSGTPNHTLALRGNWDDDSLIGDRYGPYAIGSLMRTSIKHEKGKENVIADALSRHYTMLSQLDHKFFGLESIEELYATDVDFKNAYENCRDENVE
jgi:hypothetical protein